MTKKKTYTDYGNVLLDAAEIISSRALQKATFDKTISGTVVACTDAAAGKYKIKVQDAYYYASITNEDEKYSKGDQVYILIPGNDNTKPKKIIGAVEALGDNFLATTTLEAQYDKMSKNIISKDLKYLMGYYYCTYEQYDNIDAFLLYDCYADNIIIDETTGETFKNKLKIDTGALNILAPSAEKLQISANFRTLIPAEQKRGNFGVKVDVEFYTDSQKIDTTVRSYVLDINSMVGTIYNMTASVNQKAILDFDGKMFKQIRRISTFVTGFEKNEGINGLDIFIDNIGLYPMSNAMAENWNKYYLTFDTPNGNSLADDVSSIDLIAKVTYKNRQVENTQCEYYWFIEDGSITSDSFRYCEHGGEGWRCLNDYDEIKGWLPFSHKYSISKNDTAADKTIFKCVAVQKDLAITQDTIEVYNKNAEYVINISSDLASNVFYMDQGTTTLTCQVKTMSQAELASDRFTYHWHRLNSQDKTFNLDRDNGDTLQVLDSYTNREVAEYLKDFKTHMNSFFISETKIVKKEESDSFHPNNYEDSYDVDIIKNVICKVLNISVADYIGKVYTNKEVYDKIIKYLDSSLLSYIENEKFYNLKASIINSRNTFICTVYEKTESGERYIGSASIELKNNTAPMENNYYAELINGNQLFKYDANGKSPCHKTNTSPQKLYPLSFNLFDKNNMQIDLTKSESAIVQWFVPIENTMLQYDATEDETLITDDSKEYYIIESLELPFAIADSYNSQHVNNIIRLRICYNNSELNLYSNLSFFKEGNNGTNGTDYFCRIVPNTPTNEYPTISCWLKKNEMGNLQLSSVYGNFFGDLKKEVGNKYEETTGQKNEVPWFGVELWNNGIQLAPDSVYWKILKNNTLGTVTPFKLASKESSEEVFISINEEDLLQLYEGGVSPHLILQVRVTYKGRQFFATQPIAIAIFLEEYYDLTKNITYRLNMKTGSGFNEAIYAADGTNPQYQMNEPFELEVYYDTENISLIEAVDTNRKTPLEFTWATFGAEEIEIENIDGSKHKQECTLPSQYNGFSLNNGILCSVGQTNKLEEYTEYGVIFFPIHMYLNRYGHAHLNDWDGNSIEISEDGGHILTPQVGAGRKESDNTFTGMLMGEVKTIDEKDKNKVGLIGYNHGARTMFLDAETGGAYFGATNEIAIEPDGDNTQVKLGPWVVDNESIWKDNNAFESAYGIYIGSKGISFGKQFIFNSEQNALTIPGLVTENNVTINTIKDLQSDEATITNLTVTTINGEKFDTSDSNKPAKRQWVIDKIAEHNTEAEKKFASKTDIQGYVKKDTKALENYYTKEETQEKFVSMSEGGEFDTLKAQVKDLTEKVAELEEKIKELTEGSTEA